MPRVLLVEDEPSATRYLRSIIESRCAGFEVVDTAENGAEALEKIRGALPDIVITDIKMAVMDGIELADRVGKEFPFLYTVIVSGYQEFEYARRALNSGVVDYILKPVNPGQLKTLLESIGSRIAADYNARRIELLKTAAAGSPIESWQSRKYLPFRRYGMAIARSGGLPSRYHSRPNRHDVTLDIAPVREQVSKNEIWALPGRDASELLFFHALELTKGEVFRKTVVSLSEKILDPTVFFPSGPFPLDGIASGIVSLYRALDAAIIIGHPQVVRGTTEPGPMQEDAPVLDPGLGSRFDFLLSNAMYGELEEDFRKLFPAWEKDSRPQVWVEASLRQVFQLLLRKSPRKGIPSSEDFEFLLDDAMHAAAMDELAENAWSLAARIIQCPAAPRRGANVPALLESIEDYLKMNYAEPVTLQSVCETFGVSQTYLSKLFRRHENTSFNDYLTTVRIEAAKRLILDNPSMPIKDVAGFAGYHDQFYFSRVFKTVTGISPSEYARHRLIKDS